MAIGEISVQELNDKLEGNEPVILIDCREDHEWQSGHIKEAIHIPLGQIQENYSQAIKEADHEKTIILQCRSGKRSLQAATLLEEEGLKNLYNLEGGILAWQEEGLPIIEE